LKDSLERIKKKKKNFFNEGFYLIFIVRIREVSKDYREGLYRLFALFCDTEFIFCNKLNSVIMEFRFCSGFNDAWIGGIFIFNKMGINNKFRFILVG
jgi:hypothetical protein